MPSTSPLNVDVVRVFCDEHGDHGNPLGVILDGPACPSAVERQEIAFELGFAETVFVDDVDTAALRIFTPMLELPLAGHPLVGTAWLLAERGHPARELRPPAGVVPSGPVEGGAWILADPAAAPPWELTPLGSPDEVDALDAATVRGDWVYAWAWLDEPAGIVRARAFVQEAGISEDEATGSAALMLGAQLGRAIEIHQGRGSIVHAAPGGDGLVRVEGRVVFDETLQLDR